MPALVRNSPRIPRLYLKWPKALGRLVAYRLIFLWTKAGMRLIDRCRFNSVGSSCVYTRKLIAVDEQADDNVVH
jgi:hypothetical protein